MTAKKQKYYITTAIDYVNAKPHIGHAYEKILADAVARWKRLQGYDVHFVTGTDENAQKNVQAAKENGIPIRKFVDRNSGYFIELCKKLSVNYDDFIRTTEKRHIRTAQEIFKKVADKGDIYKGKYEGYYCKGCEAFITEKDLVDGKCPEHNKKPDWISEDAYFFRLSKYEKQVLKLLEKGLVLPKSKSNEMISRIKEEGLKDLNVSRTNLDWGIDSPVDKDFKIYVWFDALINYVTASGKDRKYWPADCHVIGKGINWFHSVIWPAMLLSAGIEVPKLVWVHGYLTVDGQKMSKTLGNVINPIEIADKYGSDALRYFLLREIPFESDGDFSEKALAERYNNELANKLGNLISRVSGLIEKNGTEKTENKLIKKLDLKKIEKLMDEYHLDKALNEIFAFIDVCNEYVQEKKPWQTKDKKVLFELRESILKIAELLSPFIPESAKKITKQFSAKKIKKGEILFKKIE
jgi:methionyl-tRNA synthetase